MHKVGRVTIEGATSRQNSYEMNFLEMSQALYLKKKNPGLMLRLRMDFPKVALVVSKNMIKDGFMSFI